MKQAREKLRLPHEYLTEESDSLAFELNPEYEIEIATLPVDNCLGYEVEDVIGKSIFQFIHMSDCKEAKHALDESFKIFSEVLGLDYNEIKNVKASRLLRDREVDTLLEDYSRALRELSKYNALVHRFKRKNSELCWLDCSVVPILTPNGDIRVNVSCKDVSEQIRLQEIFKYNLLKLSKKSRYENTVRSIIEYVHSTINLQEVFDCAVDAIYANVPGAENVGIHIVEGEYAVLKAYRGYPDSFISRIKEIPYPKDYTWKTITGEQPIYCPDVERDTIIGRVGKEIGVKSYLSMPIHSRNIVIGVINISSTQKDVFDEEELILLEQASKQIETAINNARKAEILKKSEKRFRSLFENVPTGVYRIAPEGQILDANPAFISMLGYSSIDEFAAYGFTNHGFRADKDWDEIRESIEQNGYIKGMESVWKKMDGTEIFVLENITAFRTKNGNVLFYEGTVEDITERKVAENKLRNLNLNLENEIKGRTKELLEANESLVKEISERKLKEDELKSSYKQLRALTKHLESVREDERVKISREVHDELGQSLTCLKIDLGLFGKQILEVGEDTEARKLDARIRKMMALVDYNIQTVRRISMELRPGVLDDLGTVAAMEWQIQDFEKMTGIKCRFQTEVEHIPMDRELSTALFRIFQEILANIVRHSEATRVSAKLKEYDSKYVLEVTDNGVGITKQQVNAPQSLGLLGIKERALMFGGDVRIRGKRNKGTRVSVKVPKAENAND